jgi:hypothetical protein
MNSLAIDPIYIIAYRCDFQGPFNKNGDVLNDAQAHNNVRRNNEVVKPCHESRVVVHGVVFVVIFVNTLVNVVASNYSHVVCFLCD